jgi:hypothetical protein
MRWLRFLRNRGKRIGNLVRNEARHWTHRWCAEHGTAGARQETAVFARRCGASTVDPRAEP